MKGGRSDGVGSDLVLDNGGPDNGPHQPPGAAGGPDADNLPGPPVKLILQQPQQLPDSPDGVALCPDIFLRQDRVVLGDDDRFRGDRPYINPQECMLRAQRVTFFLISTISKNASSRVMSPTSLVWES